jgi:hypothetical protein
MRIVPTLQPQLIFKENFDPSKADFDLSASVVNKPNMALWTSTLISKKSSAWDKWCKDNWYPRCKGKPEKYILRPKDNLKIVEIDNDDDFKDLPTISLLDYLYKDSDKAFDEKDSILNFSRMIDFEKLANDGHDGIHLTERGATIYHTNYNSDEYTMNFNSWDAESTVWFNANWIDSIVKLY